MPTPAPAKFRMLGRILPEAGNDHLPDANAFDDRRYDRGHDLIFLSHGLEQLDAAGREFALAGQMGIGGALFGQNLLAKLQ